MKSVRLPLLLRRIHKWVGLILGIQFVLWTVSGAAMALLDRDAVGGHHGGHDMHGSTDWPGGLVAPAALGGAAVDGIALRMVAGRPVYQLSAGGATTLRDAANGRPLAVDDALARAVVAEASTAAVRSVTLMPSANLESRDHAGPIWRVDLADAEGRSAYVSAETGRLLEIRGTAWRWWDFFWMLHNMDYAKRASFNHPLIVFVAFGTLWLSLTGFYLLFKSFRRREFAWVLPRR